MIAIPSVIKKALLRLSEIVLFAGLTILLEVLTNSWVSFYVLEHPFIKR